MNFNRNININRKYDLADSSADKNDKWPSGGMVNCLPLQAEMSELKSVNCREALTFQDEGNLQRNRREIKGTFRDYNHSVQTGNAEDDGIVQTTTTSDSGSGKPGVVLRHDRFKICYPQGCGGSSPPSATIIFYKLVEFDERKLCWTSIRKTFPMFIKNAGRFLLEGKAGFEKDLQMGEKVIALADRIKNDKILESDIFDINGRLKSAFKNKYKFKFIKVS
jgi:hypothetical protein